MYLIISHFTENKGTTDYLLNYFERKKNSYYYLRHPFNFEKKLKFSELIYFDWENKKILRLYKKYDNYFLDLLRNLMLSFYISLKLSRKIDKAIWFWWFNVLPVISLKLFWKKIYFWWVDYSTKRFWNNFLNKIYLFLETLSCKYSNLVISSSNKQEQARKKFHWLNNYKWIIVNNWIDEVDFKKDFNKYDKLSFFYLWSISNESWIVDFVKYFYVKRKTENKLYIVWWWELEKKLTNLIKVNKINNKVLFLWRKNQNDIINFLSKIDEKLFWIAPYSNKSSDHVSYWDSLKLKEYLNYNLPFLARDVVYISKDIDAFWITYNNFKEINIEQLKKFNLDINKKNAVLKKYYWNNLLKSF